MKFLSLVMLLLVVSVRAQIHGDWFDASYQAFLTLNEQGQFSYQGQDGSMQGLYVVQGNIITMQDMMGNQYQFKIQGLNQQQLQVTDYLQNVYSYQRQNAITNQQLNRPWKAAQFGQILASQGQYYWRESDTQIYVSLLAFLIGGPLSNSEVSLIRSQNLIDFQLSPEIIRADVAQVENSLNQLYDLNNIETVAMVREELMAQFYQGMQQNTDLKKKPFINILNQHVQILAYDSMTHLSLTNQDVNGYVNYLIFQAQLAGHYQVLSQQERSLIHYQVVQQFHQASVAEKQVLAFASFIWDNMVKQWNAMSMAQQQQFVTQNQLQTSHQSTQVYGQNFYYVSQYNDTLNLNAIEQQYQQEAADKGMNMNEFLNYKRRDMASNQQLFTMMQNMSTENHVMMMNTINNLGDSGDYYYVDYGNDW